MATANAKEFMALWKRCRTLNERDEKMGRKFVSVYSDEQVAAMPRRHSLEHPWQRGYRNHKRIKELSE